MTSIKRQNLMASLKYIVFSFFLKLPSFFTSQTSYGRVARNFAGVTENIFTRHGCIRQWHKNFWLQAQTTWWLVFLNYIHQVTECRNMDRFENSGYYFKSRSEGNWKPMERHEWWRNVISFFKQRTSLTAHWSLSERYMPNHILHHKFHPSKISFLHFASRSSWQK